MRYFLEIAYQGTNYHGWQVQHNAQSVQSVIQEKLCLLLGTSIEITGSGRTDTGVHAEQQFAHFDSEIPLIASRFCYRLNAMLPKDISILNLYEVNAEAHARFDAIQRTYQYRIVTRKNPFLFRLSYFSNQRYYLDRMNQAAEILKKYEDFQTFSKVRTDVKHFKCQISEAIWKDEGDLLIFEISANRFLRGMVRAIVGTLLEVGVNKMSLHDFETVIQSKDRNKAGRAVPAEGLFLTKVQYPFL